MLFENNTKKVLDRFFIRPTEEFHLRKLARETKLSTTAVKNAIDSLKKERLVNVEKTKIKTTMIANRSDKFIRLKKLFNLKSIYLSEFYEKLIKDYKKPECIILFGSYMRGEDIERSDIDITVITEKEKKDYREYEKEFQRKINIITINKEKITKEFLNTLVNGIILYGYLDIK